MLLPFSMSWSERETCYFLLFGLGCHYRAFHDDISCYPNTLLEFRCQELVVVDGM